MSRHRKEQEESLTRRQPLTSLYSHKIRQINLRNPKPYFVNGNRLVRPFTGLRSACLSDKCNVELSRDRIS